MIGAWLRVALEGIRPWPPATFVVRRSYLEGSATGRVAIAMRAVSTPAVCWKFPTRSSKLKFTNISGKPIRASDRSAGELVPSTFTKAIVCGQPWSWRSGAVQCKFSAAPADSKKQLADAGFSLFLGWWAFPWGLLHPCRSAGISGAPPSPAIPGNPRRNWRRPYGWRSPGNRSVHRNRGPDHPCCPLSAWSSASASNCACQSNSLTLLGFSLQSATTFTNISR